MSNPTPLGGRIVSFFSSYALAIVLLACLFLLTLFGTLYQVDHGLHAAKLRFFSSWFLWSNIGSLRIPTFPAGLTCMALLTVNMLVGGMLRIKITQRNLGVVVIHLGIAFLLISGLVKQWTAQEGYLSVAEGRTSEEFRSDSLWEVALWELDGSDSVQEFVIRHDEFVDLRGSARRTFTCVDLPFQLVLRGFLPSAAVRPAGPGDPEEGVTRVDGFDLVPMPVQGEVGRNGAGVHIEVLGAGDSREACLWGFQLWPWTFEWQGKTYAVNLRHASYKMPFALRLESFEKEDHPGMTMARSYRSDVTKIDAGREEAVRIQMNEPLRSDGLVLFQSSWGPQDAAPARPCSLDVAGDRVLMFGHGMGNGYAVRMINAAGEWGTYAESGAPGTVQPLNGSTTFYVRDVTGDGFKLSTVRAGPAVDLLSAGQGHTLQEEPYSVFSVVRNVSDKWPEYSMWVITVGMLMAFGRKLLGFLRVQESHRRKAAQAQLDQGGTA